MRPFKRLLWAGTFLTAALFFCAPAEAQYYGYSYGYRPYYPYYTYRPNYSYSPFGPWWDDSYRTGIYGGLYNYSGTGFYGTPLYGELGFPGPGYYPQDALRYYTRNWWNWRW